MYFIMKKIFLLCFVFILLSSCVVGGVTDGDVIVKVVSFHQDDIVRTSSGRPLIFAKGSREYCRWRPFDWQFVREQFSKQGLEKEALDELFFDGAVENEETESSDVELEDKPVFIEVGNNWTTFGLLIQNNTDDLLIIDTVLFQARANCGSETFTHSGEISSSYCSGERGAPFLYIVLPKHQINYTPNNSNSLNNLRLFIDGFPIIDRTGEPSTSFQSSFRAIGANEGTPPAGATEAGTGAGAKCEPHKIVVTPIYQVELTLIGYFIFMGEEESRQTGRFTKRVRFSTTVIN